MMMGKLMMGRKVGMSIMAAIAMVGVSGCGSSNASRQDGNIPDGMYNLAETITGGTCQSSWPIGTMTTDMLIVSNGGATIMLNSIEGSCTGNAGDWVCSIPEPSGGTTQLVFVFDGSSGSETISADGCQVDLNISVQ